MPNPQSPIPTPTRLLAILPSWVGDTVMATPALRCIRDAMPGIFIGALCRPGIDQLLSGSNLIDELHTFQPHGMMAPKHAAAKVRPRQYDAALLFTNSFSTALIARLAFIPRRIGYDRDTRGMLLTDRLEPPRNPDSTWKLTPAVDYYWNLAAHLLGRPGVDWSIHTPTDCTSVPLALPPGVTMELPETDADRHAADALLARAQIPTSARLAILNPGGNNPAKRWPPDRFAHLARHLIDRHGMSVLVNGSPGEAELCGTILKQVAPSASGDTARSPGLAACSLPDLGITLGALKSLCRRASLMVTNDTGPRHIAAAFGTPLVTLFGPTDPRWTTIPVRTNADKSPRETVLVADPTLPPSESANDHPERCRVDRIGLDAVIEAADGQLARA